jgi:ubiquinone/menaquinone biosynthesis C-methylase UbiE
VSRFGDDPHAFFQSVYARTAPWDIGAPQPALMTLLDEYPPSDPILDVGCGSGDLAIALAERGFEVLAIDFAEGAITEARRRTRQLAADAGSLTFEVADALRPSTLGRRFGCVVDSGFFHLFEPEDGRVFIDDLGSTLRSGGRYYLLAFATTFPIPNTPRAVDEPEVRALFTRERGWEILECRSAEFMSRIAPVPAIAVCVERR